MSLGRVGAVTAALLLVAGTASAEEWHEAYRAGVQALARGDSQQAVASLRRAISLRPQPGRNVVTYGTNIEARYFPYLRLAEAQLALGQLEAARQALQASEARKLEPAEERRQLQERLESLLEARRPPPTTAPAAPAPHASAPDARAEAPPPTPPPAAPVPAIETAASTAALAPARSPATEAGRVGRELPRPVAPVAALPAATETEAAATGGPGSIEIISQPAGALAFVDDEPLGSTDPVSGRLVKTGLHPGRHHVRLTLAGHEDAVRDVEVAPHGSVSLYATLAPRAAAPGPGGVWLTLTLLALTLVVAAAWMMLRPQPSPESSRAATPRPDVTPRPAAPRPEGSSPGAHRDELGQEWFGEYRLIEPLGRGGMATVFKAERSGELVALKRPLPRLLEDSDFLERFLREAEIGRTLNHPNIVRILGRGRVERVPYFTMELVPGQTLQARIADRGAAEPRVAVSVVAQVAEALDFAHGKGVIHRDLKPSNIMLLPDGHAKVMDFGIARASRFEGITATGAFLGTPDYVAPELVEGGVAEPRSDLYSLGALFYELLTGQRPFTGETAFAVLRKHCTEEARPPSRLQPGIPPRLDALVLSLLAKAPAARPANAEELVVALRDWLNRAA